MRIFWAIIALLALAAAGAWYAKATRGPGTAAPPTEEPLAPAASTASRDASSAAPVVTARASNEPIVPPSQSEPAQAARTETSAPTLAPIPENPAAPSAALDMQPVDSKNALAPAAAAGAPARQSPEPALVSPKPESRAATAPAPNAAGPETRTTEPSAPDAPKSTAVNPAIAQSEAPKTDAPKPAAIPENEKTKQPISVQASPETSSDIANGLDDLLGVPTATPKPVLVDSPKPADSAKSGPPAAAPAKLKLVPQDDGSVLVDDKYVIKGKGTKDDPYRITWEMLVSAQESYQPRLGRKVIPERIKMIDGKWVRISGYIAFPIMAQSADEMLMMLNQWDGCCIGVPPTPYDAIEVKLKQAAKGDTRLRTTGALNGILRVDPYLVKDWLVSLYVMDDGEIVEAAGTAQPGQHAK